MKVARWIGLSCLLAEVVIGFAWLTGPDPDWIGFALTAGPAAVGMVATVWALGRRRDRLSTRLAIGCAVAAFIGLWAATAIYSATRGK